MADWTLPTNSSSYLTAVLAVLKARDEDAGTLCVATPTNPVTGMMRWVRATDKFEEYSGSAWVAQLISVAGGGTGSDTASGARTNLGLGTLAVQNSNAVSISGGTISGLSTLGVSGTVTAGLFSGSGASLTSIPNAATTATNLNTAAAIVSRDVSGNFSAGTITANLTGNVSGTVTNGVVTTGSYADPSWITALSASKLLTGSLADGRLSANVPLINAANVFTAPQSATSATSGQPGIRIALSDTGGGEYNIIAGGTENLFTASALISILQQQGSNYIDPPDLLQNVKATLAGAYLVIAHITLLSTSANNSYRLRLFAGSTYNTESQIIGRNETFVAGANEYVVLSCSGIAIVPANYQFGVMMYSENAAKVVSFAGQQNNTLTVMKLW